MFKEKTNMKDLTELIEIGTSLLDVVIELIEEADREGWTLKDVLEGLHTLKEYLKVKGEEQK